MVCRPEARPMVRVAIAVCVAATVAGCASVRQRVGGWFGRKSAPETVAGPQAPRAFYARTEGLKVYSEPSASSKVVGTLSLHEKVTRSKVERGYAYVESTKSVVKGWVDNAKLTWRSPTAPTAAAPAPAEAEPEEAAAPAEEEPQPPAAPERAATDKEQQPASAAAPAVHPRSKPTPSGPPPSILDAY